MTGDTRATIFGDDDLELDLSGFTTRQKADGPPKEAVAAVAGAAGFSPREAQNQRRWRTGRNVQLNVKVTAETAARVRAISDRHGWPLAVTMERAIAALAKELGDVDIG